MESDTCFAYQSEAKHFSFSNPSSKSNTATTFEAGANEPFLEKRAILKAFTLNNPITESQSKYLQIHVLLHLEYQLDIKTCNGYSNQLRKLITSALNAEINNEVFKETLDSSSLKERCEAILTSCQSEAEKVRRQLYHRRNKLDRIFS